MRVKEQSALSVCDVESAKRVDLVSLNSSGTTSFFKTCFNCLNALSGAGIMSISYALSCGGWLSLILLFIIASITFYTGLLTKRCMEVDPNIRSYPDIGDKAFGTKGRILVLIFMNLELYLIATGFLILAGDNLHKLMPFLETKVHGIPVGGRRSLVVLIALVIMPTVWIDKMTTLSYVSATGVLASLVILGSILLTGISDGIGFHQKGVLLNWSGLPTAFSLYTLCYCAHAVFPTLCTSMRDQRQFSSVLLACFLYVMFGSEIQSHITLNLPTNNLSSKVAVYTCLIIPIAKYALMLKPVIETIECYFQSSGGKRFYSLFLRTMLVIISIVVAVTIPFFGYLMSLVGAFLSVTSSILLPCFCYLKISGAYRKLDFELASIDLIVLTGLIVFVIGTYTSLLDIIHSL
ncbi:Amino acid transporter [Handroanthus impetiginosus]|uniref:Amino acid transporter n=1 Tax=Handroanthus impetiginosus TaxID=429701 RepID=A0A2G9GHF9_9LAMI|nr:Amino acid transporter [Handroanthus impetiginosus]